MKIDFETNFMEEKYIPLLIYIFWYQQIQLNQAMFNTHRTNRFHGLFSLLFFSPPNCAYYPIKNIYKKIKLLDQLVKSQIVEYEIWSSIPTYNKNFLM